MNITQRAFNGEQVQVDGVTFRNCSFTDCTLTYSGGPRPMFHNCHFDNHTWQFSDAAQRTLEYMVGLVNMFAPTDVGQKIVTDVFNIVLAGKALPQLKE